MLFDLSYKLNPEEKLVGLARKHWFLLVPRLLEYLFIIALLIAFVNRFFIFREAFAISSFLLVIYSIYLIYRWILWRADYYVITSERIIKIAQSGILEKTLGEISLRDIQDVSFNSKGVAAVFFKFGTIKISLKDGRSFKMEAVSFSDKIYQTVIKLKEISQ